MAELLKGLPVAQALSERVAQHAAALAERGVIPTLAIVRVGERADDLAYERGACKRCENTGILVRKYALPADCSQEQIMETIANVNEDDAVHGCLMFRPLPSHLDEEEACAALVPTKDVDCATEGSREANVVSIAFSIRCCSSISFIVLHLPSNGVLAFPPPV